MYKEKMFVKERNIMEKEVLWILYDLCYVYKRLSLMIF